MAGTPRIVLTDGDLEDADLEKAISEGRMAGPKAGARIGPSLPLAPKQPTGTFPSPAATPQDIAGGGDLPECLVTLQQAAPTVHRSKRTLERLKSKSGFPRPRVIGGGGKPHLYDWAEMRTFLQREYKIPLPERFHFERFRPT